jgi:Protein of unknown function (DUF1592)/Protein of unknown function (DUF1588)/Protein of unknown function (DUF1595)/Protein of unknown function (DUF1585)/Protein of unknown function (DUF1587)
MKFLQILGVVAGVSTLVGCRDDGASGDGSGTDTTGMGDSTDSADESGGPADLEGLGTIGLRRLTRYEYDNTLRDILGDDTRPGSQGLPEDPLTPFDNEYAQQEASQPLIEGLEVLARDVAQRLVDDPERRDQVVGCTPASDDDEACLRAFVGRFGRLALRRPLATDEIDEFVALGREYAEREADFYAGVAVVVRALLQDAEFVYRVEQGTPVAGEPGAYALGDFEIATRLSFLVWGTTPSDALLDAAEAGELHTPEQLQAMVESMMQDPRAEAQIDRFHAMWLGYAQLPHAPALTNAMRTETAALVQRVVFDEQQPWTALFTATDTFIDATLAEHYGLPAPAEGTSWVSYGDSGRQGILSHGAFLSVAAGPGDTSPVRRGKLIREQLMCQTIPPPPPNVDADVPPPQEDAECKWDRYATHREAGSCAGCHAQMDPIGFGLESYDREGHYRTHDEGAPQCIISGDGELVGFGAFNGPAELADLLVSNTVLEPCVARQLYRFALGRPLGTEDQALVLDLAAGLVEGDGRFDTMLGALVSHPAFIHRREEG